MEEIRKGDKEKAGRMEEIRGSQFEPLILRLPATEMPNGGKYSLRE